MQTKYRIELLHLWQKTIFFFRRPAWQNRARLWLSCSSFEAVMCGNTHRRHYPFAFAVYMIRRILSVALLIFLFRRKKCGKIKKKRNLPCTIFRYLLQRKVLLKILLQYLEWNKKFINNKVFDSTSLQRPPISTTKYICSLIFIRRRIDSSRYKTFSLFESAAWMSFISSNRTFQLVLDSSFMHIWN